MSVHALYIHTRMSVFSMHTNKYLFAHVFIHTHIHMICCCMDVVPNPSTA